MRSMVKFGFVSAVALVFLAEFAAAHHSTVGRRSDEITRIEGIIKEFQYQNPHSWIQVYVTDERGDRVEWSVEWGIPNMLYRRGYGPSTFTPGDEVIMLLRRDISGRPLGGFVGVKLGDGTTIGNWEEE